ncbi:shikimate dehydrogenase [Alphaproteobacteria bacterium]|nr:shikimate dehydrogenase [Alphaproteobacteria bacterium]
MTKEMPWVTGASRVFGTIAYPPHHVRAPMLFNALFAERGLDNIMVPIDAPPADLAAVIAGLRKMPNFGGLAVTIPHKIALADMCDSLGAVAKITGAVNAIRFDPDGSMHGDNFDGEGFVTGLALKGHSVAGKTILMIGAGGAARAIAAAVCAAGAEKLIIVNRTVENAEALRNALVKEGNHHQSIAQDSHDGSGVDIIINTTSLGLKPGDDLPLALDHVDDNTLIADIIMIPEQTAWLLAAEQRGLEIHYGRHMLDCQIELIGSFIGAL